MSPVNKLIVFTVLMILIPRGMAISLDLTSWVLFAIIFLLPSFIEYLLKSKLKLDLSNFLFIALFVSLILGSIITGEGKTGLRAVFPQFFYYFLPFFAGKYFIKSKNDLFKFFYILIVVAIVVDLIAIFEFITKQSFYSYFNFLMLSNNNLWENSQQISYKGSMIRSIASFGQGIYLGVFLGFTMILSSSLTFISRIDFFVFRKKIVLLQIFLSLIGIFLSQSRTAMLALPIILVINIILNIKRLNLSVAISLTIFLIFSISIILIVFSSILDEFLYENISSRDSMVNVTSRFDIAQQGYDLVKNDLTFWGEKTNRIFYYITTMDVLNGFIFKFLFHGIAYGIIYLCFWLVSIKEAYVLDKYISLKKLLIFIMIYFFIVTNITTLYFQNEIIFFIFSGIVVNPYLRTSINPTLHERS